MLNTLLKAHSLNGNFKSIQVQQNDTNAREVIIFCGEPSHGVDQELVYHTNGSPFMINGVEFMDNLDFCYILKFPDGELGILSKEVFESFFMKNGNSHPLTEGQYKYATIQCPKLETEITFHLQKHVKPCSFQAINLDADFERCVNARHPDTNILNVKKGRDAISLLKDRGCKKVAITQDGMEILGGYLVDTGEWVLLGDVESIDMEQSVASRAYNVAIPIDNDDIESIQYIAEYNNVKCPSNFELKLDGNLPYIDFFGAPVACKLA
ncbi:hypothetical protein VCHA53O466_50198 [Vibrio chagasii]|nr:hypothetical protein VCHA53O466_50198 [Vibrio chagasii]